MIPKKLEIGDTIGIISPSAPIGVKVKLDATNCEVEILE